MNRLCILPACFAAATLLCASAAIGAEPMPDWDVKQGALDDSTEMLRGDEYELGRPQPSAEEKVKYPEDWARRLREDAEAADIIKAGPEALFNRYLVWHRRARDYIAAHWSQYSKYDQLSCVKCTTAIAVEWSAKDHIDGHPIIPPKKPVFSCPYLSMCLPGGIVRGNPPKLAIGDLPN
jgi:hypothetical protein